MIPVYQRTGADNWRTRRLFRSVYGLGHGHGSHGIPNFNISSTNGMPCTRSGQPAPTRLAGSAGYVYAEFGFHLPSINDPDEPHGEHAHRI